MTDLRQALAAALLFAAPLQEARRRPSDYELWRRFESASKVCIEAEGPKESIEAVDRARDLLRESDPREVSIVPIGAAASARAARIVVGTSVSPPLRDALGGASGLLVEDGRIVVEGRELNEPGDAVAFFTEVRGRPIAGIVAHRDEALAALLGRLPFPTRPGFRIVRAGEPDAPAAGADAALEGDDRGTVRYRFARGAFDRASIDAVHSRSERARARLKELIGDFAPPAIEVRLYRSPLDKERITGDGEASHANLIGHRVHAAEAPGLEGCDGADLARVVAFKELGFARDRWLADGLADACAVDAEGRGAERDTPRLAAAGLAGTAGELLHPWVRGHRSPLVVRPLQASLVCALARKLGPARFRVAFRGGPDMLALPALSALFRETLDAAAATRPAPPPARAAAPANGLLSGVSVSWLRPGGAPSAATSDANDELAARLERLRAVGGKAVMLEPVRSLVRGQGSVTASLRGRGPLGTSDAELAWIAGACRARGLAVGVRSEIRSIRSGKGFGDAFDVDPSGKWGSYFADYREVLAHDALLAERIGADWLVVGSAMRGATSSPEAVRRFAEEIERVRALFGGALAYAATEAPVARRVGAGEISGPPSGELEECALWPFLDAAGALAPTPPGGTDPEIEVAARAHVELLEAVCARAGKRALELDLEPRAARFYAGALAGRPWLAGAFVRGWLTADEEPAVADLFRRAGSR